MRVFPTILAVVFIVAGSMALGIAIWQLWPVVWPLVLGGCGFGLAMLGWVGLDCETGYTARRMGAKQ